MNVEDPCWTRSIKGPANEDGIFLMRKFTLQEDKETVLVHEKRMRQINTCLDVPTRVLLRRKSLAETEKKQERVYQPFVRSLGSSNMSLTVIEEQPITLNLNSESAQKQQLSSMITHSTLESTHVKCHNCGGFHFTHNCPQKETYKRDIITAKGGVYVPPSKKSGVDKKTYSLKLDPVPNSWMRENLQKLVDILVNELREMLKAKQNGEADAPAPASTASNTSGGQMSWREKVQRLAEQRSDQNESRSIAKVEETAKVYEDTAESDREDTPEDEELATLRLAITGLRLERSNFPTSKIDGSRQGYAYINLGSEEAQRAFKARWDGAKLRSEQMIMHVLLPEEYGPARK